MADKRVGSYGVYNPGTDEFLTTQTRADAEAIQRDIIAAQGRYGPKGKTYKKPEVKVPGDKIPKSADIIAGTPRKGNRLAHWLIDKLFGGRR